VNNLFQLCSVRPQSKQLENNIQYLCLTEVTVEVVVVAALAVALLVEVNSVDEVVALPEEDLVVAVVVVVAAEGKRLSLS